MDLEMPRQNGLKTIQNIRSEKLAEGTPIVLCTGCTGETKLAESLSIADYRITKPFELEEVEDDLEIGGIAASLESQQYYWPHQTRAQIKASEHQRKHVAEAAIKK